MKITNGSTSCCILYYITTSASIELLVCVPSMLPPQSPRLLTTVYNQHKNSPHSRKDSVRVSKLKTIFDKGTPNWSSEVFKIIKVQQTKPMTYLLDSRGEPIARVFYEYELHSITNFDVHLIEKVLRKSKNEVYVK